MVFLLLLSLLFTSNSQANNCNNEPSVDHSAHFSHSVEAQHDVSACHTFTTLSLVEFNYYKKTGHKINLSEHDLLLSHLIWDAKSNEAASLLRSMLNLNYQVSPRSFTPSLSIAGNVKDDLFALKKFGVATESMVPYRFKRSEEVFQDLVKTAHVGRKIYGEIKSCPREDIGNVLDEKFKNETFDILTKMNVNKSFARINTPQVLSTRQNMKDFSKTLTYNKIRKPTLKQILKVLKNRPVGASVQDYQGLISKGAITDYQKHSVLITGYNCLTNKFIIRNSATGTIDFINPKTLLKGLESIDIIK